jgi:antitoxin CptB
MAPTLAASPAALPPEGAVSAWGGPAPERPAPDATQLLDARALSKLKWRCRRGLLENDLFIERFFLRHESGLTVRLAQGLDDLMDLSDNDLLDLLLQRKEPGEVSAASAATAEALEVLSLMRTPSLAR